MLSLYHALQMHVDGEHGCGSGAALQRAGLFSAKRHASSSCFLYITGYTQLTQERGDACRGGARAP